MRENNFIIKRGDIYWADLGNGNGSEQGGLRPVIIVSNRRACEHSPVVSVSPITSKLSKKLIPTHVLLDYKSCGLKSESQILTEQIITVDKIRLQSYIGRINKEDTEKLNKALEVSLEVGEAKDRFNENARAIGIAKRKAEGVKELDIFIKMWLDKQKPLDVIMDYIEDRRIKINDLKRYCRNFDLNVIDFYVEQIMGNNESVRMVG